MNFLLVVLLAYIGMKVDASDWWIAGLTLWYAWSLWSRLSRK